MEFFGDSYEKLLLGSVALMVLSSAAHAADLGSRPYTKAPAYVQPSYDWSGFYVGGHVGYAWGREYDNLSESVFRVPLDNFKVDGVIGGVHAGYNWQTGNFVFGLEGDFDGSGIRGSDSFDAGSFVGTLSFKNDWQASIRARAGYAPDNWLIYVTGGAAFAGVKATLSGTVRGSDFQSSSIDTLTGWTVGLGAEHALSKNWIVRGEVRHTDFGNGTLPLADNFDAPFPTRVRFTDTRATFGLSYKF